MGRGGAGSMEESAKQIPFFFGNAPPIPLDQLTVSCAIERSSSLTGCEGKEWGQGVLSGISIWERINFVLLRLRVILKGGKGKTSGWRAYFTNFYTRKRWFSWAIFYLNKKIKIILMDFCYFGSIQNCLDLNDFHVFFLDIFCICFFRFNTFFSINIYREKKFKQFQP